MAIIQKLLIKCKQEVLDDISLMEPPPPSHWFEVEGDYTYLVLHVDREKYTPIRNEDGERGRYKDAANGAFSPLVLTRIGFEAAIVNSHADLVYILERISYHSTSPNLQTHYPVEIYDYVRPEWDGRISSRPIGSKRTLRTGKLFVGEKTGMVSGKTSMYGSGFSIRFEEKEKRRISG